MNSAEYRRAIEKVLDRTWSDWSIQHGGKHLKITLRRGTRTRFVTAAITPSDYRGIHNFTRDLRRVVRELKEMKP